MKWIIVPLLIIMLAVSLSFAKVRDVKTLQWIDPQGRQPAAFLEWYEGKRCCDSPTTIGTVGRKGTAGRQNVVDIVVNRNIYDALSAELDTFTNDLVAAGYTVQLDTISGMSHTALRSHLAGILHLVGAIFVGELPVAWFETNGFGNWEEFPHDIYFSDLDGSYLDSDVDGIYDNHYGSTAPEIWVGRIYARNLTWDSEINLLKNYFRKNHDYRVNGSALQQRGLSFVDDDWSYWGNCYLNLVYSNIVVVNSNYQTTAANYRSHLDLGYEWIHLCAHSSPWGHTFLYGTSGYRGTVFNYEVFSLEPAGHFYNLFACSGTRFVEENHSAGWYIFQDPYGLLAIGSTKTGSMLYFDDFYGPLGQQNLCIGDAFKSWFTTWGEYDWDWFYGMNILGDPTLKPRSAVKRAIRDKGKKPQQEDSDWETPEIVAPDGESDGFPRITTNTDGRTWIIWESGRSLSNGRSDIFASFNQGSGWSNASPVGPVYYWDYCPDIAIDHLNRPVAVWAGWYSSYGNYQYDIFYSVFAGSWGGRQQLHALDPGIDLNPVLVQDQGGTLWACWESSRALDRNIYISSFSGSSWSSPQRITPSSDNEVTPCAAADSVGNLWVFHSRRAEDKAEIWAHYYNGSQWVESGPVSGAQEHAYHPCAAVEGDGTVWVAWHATDGGCGDIFTSFYDGSTWSMPIQLTTSMENDLFPDMAAEHGGPLWLVYQSKESGDWDIHFCNLDSSAWSDPMVLNAASGADINPRVTCSDEDEVWVTWQSYASGNWEIMVTHQDGLTVSQDAEKDSDSRFTVFPSISSGTIWIHTEAPGQEVSVFDVRGACVRTLRSSEKNRICWSADHLRSGTYFVVLEARGQRLIEKVALIK
jgi:hypothetical protein